LQAVMQRFFDEAPPYAEEVLRKQREALIEAQRRASVAATPKKESDTKSIGRENASNGVTIPVPNGNLKPAAAPATGQSNTSWSPYERK